MPDNNCPSHGDHTERIKKLENKYDDLDDRVTVLDKETAVSRAEIVGVLKNLESLPATMDSIGKTMVSMQGEISKSNDRMGSLEKKFGQLDSRITQVDEEGKFNIRKWIKDNWIGLAIGLTALIYIGTELIKSVAK